jgi:branched-chain amino acid transport system permease protein
MIGRQRLHRWVLWAPNLIARQFGGRKTAIAIPESDAP